LGVPRTIHGGYMPVTLLVQFFSDRYFSHILFAYEEQINLTFLL
jgi:hypothetical protein